MGKQKCKTKLVTDAPTENDFFEGSGHLTLAKTIEEIINNETGGKTIGLEGEWGSGKSTIISFIQKKLEYNKNHIFIFDAWAHEGDPLRRTFLEKLIDELQKRKWIIDENANCNRNKLSGKIVTTNIKSTPQFTKTGKCAILSALISPIGLAFLNKSLNDSVSPFVPNNGMNPCVLFSLGFILIPWIITIVFAIKDHDYSAIVKEFRTDKETITNESPNPTSVEFETIFLNILQEALEGENKLIIVLDNLDRISKDDAIKILSTLQTFLYYCQQSNQDHNMESPKQYLEKLWVIIPYDRNGLIKLWDDKDNSNIASHMLEKRFQLRFYVPPIILSDWKNYLWKLMGEALPGHSSEDELERVFQIINLTWIKHNPNIKFEPDHELQIPFPTPRQLITLVNQIGIIHRQWCSKGIPFSHIVFYSTFRYLNQDIKIDEIPLFSDNFPKEPISTWFYDEKNEFWESFATLWFNIDTSLACQILFRFSIINSLQGGDFDKLEQINKKTSKCWEIISASYGTILNLFTKAEDYINAISCLSKCNLLDNVDKPIQRDFLLFTRDAVLETPLTLAITSEMGERILLLLSLVKDDRLFERIISFLGTDLHKPQNKSLYTSENISGWLDVCIAVLSEYRNDHQVLPINIPGDEDTRFFATILLTTKDPKGEYWVNFSSISEEQFITSFSNFVNQGRIRTDYVYIINYIKKNYSKRSFSWNAILELLDSRSISQATDFDNQDLDEIAGLYSIFWKIMSISPENLALGESILAKKQIPQGIILNYLRIFIDTDRYVDSAKFLFYYFASVPNYQLPIAAIGKAREGFDHIKKDLFIDPEKHIKLTEKFVDILLSENKIALIPIIWASTNDSRKWISYCLYLLSKNSKIKEINPEFLLENWLILKTNLDDKWHEFINSIIKETELLDILQKKDFDINQAKIIQDIVSFDQSKRIQSFGIEVIKKIREIDKETWHLELQKTNSEVLALISELQKIGYRIDLELAFVESIIDYGINVILGKIQNCINPDFFDFIANTNFRRHLHSRLFKKLIDLKNGIPENFIKCFGDEMLDKEAISNKNDFIDNCIIPALERREISCLNWFFKFLVKEPAFFKINKNDFSLTVLKTKISDLLKGELDVDFKKILTQINENLS